MDLITDLDFISINEHPTNLLQLHFNKCESFIRVYGGMNGLICHLWFIHLLFAWFGSDHRVWFLKEELRTCCRILVALYLWPRQLCSQSPVWWSCFSYRGFLSAWWDDIICNRMEGLLEKPIEACGLQLWLRWAFRWVVKLHLWAAVKALTHRVAKNTSNARSHLDFVIALPISNLQSRFVCFHKFIGRECIYLKCRLPTTTQPIL